LNIYQDVYDLIIFRDVIEHIADKQRMLDACAGLLAPDGRMLMTFPPFYSPFGAHQQVFSKRFVTRLPYIQFLPKSMYLKFVKWMENGNVGANRVAAEIRDSKTTISSLKKHLTRSAFEIEKEHDYIIRPSFEIRHGVRPRKAAWLGHIPLLRELLIMGVYLILKRRETP